VDYVQREGGGSAAFVGVSTSGFPIFDGNYLKEGSALLSSLEFSWETVAAGLWKKGSPYVVKDHPPSRGVVSQLILTTGNRQRAIRSSDIGGRPAGLHGKLFEKRGK